MSSTEEVPADNTPSPIEPYLPPELERAIFTNAFQEFDYQTNIDMSLVARRVRDWIRPLMYRVVDQLADRPIPDFTIESCPPVEDIGKFVYHAILSPDFERKEEVRTFLKHCPNLRSLASWDPKYTELVFQILDEMKMNDLRILSANISTLPAPGPLFNQAMFHVTQLELVSMNIDILQLLPSFVRQSQVTHLRLYNLICWERDHIVEVLQAPSSIEVFAVCEAYLDQSDVSGRQCPPELQTLHQEDPRFVILDSRMSTSDDWVSGVKGNFDCWMFAAQVVTARRQNYFKKGDFRDQPFQRNFNWWEHLVDEGKEWYANEVEKGHYFPRTPAPIDT